MILTANQTYKNNNGTSMSAQDQQLSLCIGKCSTVIEFPCILKKSFNQ